MPTGAALRPAGDACDTCPAKHGRCLLPEPADPSRIRLAVVGDSPMRRDLEEKAILSGGSGRMLQRGLRSNGLQRSEVHFTNAVLCECAEEHLSKARAACAVRLRSELEASGAGAVMPLGPLGLQSTLALPRKPQILKWRGSVSRVEWGPARSAFVLPTLHPSFVYRAPKWAPILELDVARVGRVLENGFTAPEDAPGRKLWIPKTRDSLREALSSLSPGADTSFDVETVGLGPSYTSLVCFGLSDGRLTVVIPWSKASNGIEPFWKDGGTEAAELTSACLASRCAITHNGPAFDHIVAARYGIRIAAWGDTLLLAHAMAAHMPKNLAHVASLYLDVPPWKQLEDRGVDIERLHVYNGRDCLYTALAWSAAKEIAL
jgi:uracil-DNA glycosylase family 4